MTSLSAVLILSFVSLLTLTQSANITMNFLLNLQATGITGSRACKNCCTRGLNNISHETLRITLVSVVFFVSLLSSLPFTASTSFALPVRYSLYVPFLTFSTPRQKFVIIRKEQFPPHQDEPHDRTDIRTNNFLLFLIAFL